MALTYPAKLGIAIDLLISGCPSPVLSRLSETPCINLRLTRESLDVCALTAAKGVCSGSIESIFPPNFSYSATLRLLFGRSQKYAREVQMVIVEGGAKQCVNFAVSRNLICTPVRVPFVQKSC